jgi:hypothetical protein
LNLYEYTCMLLILRAHAKEVPCTNHHNCGSVKHGDKSKEPIVLSVKAHAWSQERIMGILAFLNYIFFLFWYDTL